MNVILIGLGVKTKGLACTCNTRHRQGSLEQSRLQSPSANTPTRNKMQLHTHRPHSSSFLGLIFRIL